jgi:hypothetical protein
MIEGELIHLLKEKIISSLRKPETSQIITKAEA